MRGDLNLHGTQYNWLSSIFYFGFLAWAFPTNFLMQRLPIGILHSEQTRKLRPNRNSREISRSKHLHVVGCAFGVDFLGSLVMAHTQQQGLFSHASGSMQ